MTGKFTPQQVSVFPSQGIISEKKKKKAEGIMAAECPRVLSCVSTVYLSLVLSTQTGFKG